MQSRFPEFRRAIADYLRGRLSASQALAAVGPLVWGGWCGTGADSLYTPKDKILLLALLELGRYDLAAGVALSLAPPRPPWGRVAGRNRSRSVCSSEGMGSRETLRSGSREAISASS